VTFGAQLQAGASVDLFGMQAEAQLAPSDYKMTETQGGVYANARFGADQLTVTAQSTDVYDAVIQIVNTELMMPTIDTSQRAERAADAAVPVRLRAELGLDRELGTHAVTFSGTAYSARLLKHSLFKLRGSSIDGLDGSAAE
jgi:hypothetical protein